MKGYMEVLKLQSIFDNDVPIYSSWVWLQWKPKLKNQLPKPKFVVASGQHQYSKSVRICNSSKIWMWNYDNENKILTYRKNVPSKGFETQSNFGFSSIGVGGRITQTKQH